MIEQTEEGIIKSINKINKIYTDTQLICIMRGGGAKSDLEWLNNFNIALIIPVRKDRDRQVSAFYYMIHTQ